LYILVRRTASPRRPAGGNAAERRLRTMFNLGLGEWIVILVIVLLLFGAGRIPEVMRSLGKGVSEFKKGMKDLEAENSDTTKPTDKKG
jgi:sec-independent protein translocase protein TatA